MPLGDGRFDSAAPARRRATAQPPARRLRHGGGRARAGTVVSAVMFGAIAASGVLAVRARAVRSRDPRVGPRRRGEPGRVSRAPGMRCRRVDGGCVRRRRDRSRRPAARPAGPARRRRRSSGISRADARASLRHGLRAPRSIFRTAPTPISTCSAWPQCSPPSAEADPSEANGFALTRETARFLALWMAFDDIVRVADLKCRASRFARVRREVGAGDGDVVRIVDYFKPGCARGRVAAAAGAGPTRSRRGTAGARRRAGHRGRSRSRSAPTASPASSRCATLASLRWLRRRGARFGQEQALIERWLGAIETAAGTDWRLAHEIALCGRLVKGYGATNERGKENLLHILDQIVAGRTPRRRGRNASCARPRRARGGARRRRRQGARSGARRARRAAAPGEGAADRLDEASRRRRRGDLRGAARHDAAPHDTLHRRVRRLRSRADRLLPEFPQVDRLGGAAFLRGGRGSAVVGRWRPQTGIIGTPLVEVSARFVRPATYGDEIAVESWIDEWREQELRDEARGAPRRRRAGRGPGDRVFARRHPDNPEANRRDRGAGRHSPAVRLREPRVAAGGARRK